MFHDSAKNVAQEELCLPALSRPESHGPGPLENTSFRPFTGSTRRTRGGLKYRPCCPQPPRSSRIRRRSPTVGAAWLSGCSGKGGIAAREGLSPMSASREARSSRQNRHESKWRQRASSGGFCRSTWLGGQPRTRYASSKAKRCSRIFFMRIDPLCARLGITPYHLSGKNMEPMRSS